MLMEHSCSKSIPRLPSRRAVVVPTRLRGPPSQSSTCLILESNPSSAILNLAWPSSYYGRSHFCEALEHDETKTPARLIAKILGSQSGSYDMKATWNMHTHRHSTMSSAFDGVQVAPASRSPQLSPLLASACPFLTTCDHC